MESIRGKSSYEIEAAELKRRLSGYDKIYLDIGTGDGRFVRHTAEKAPDRFVIGLDACRENLRAASRVARPNALFLIASAQALPRELKGLVTHITVNFPWGSLLESFLMADPALLGGLVDLACPGARLELRLNAGALAETGWTLDAGAQQVSQILGDTGFKVGPGVNMDSQALRVYPTTWAKRLAFGRDPQAWLITAVWKGQA